MKIVIVIDGFTGLNGGIVATKRLIDELIVRGHKVAIVSADKTKNENYEHYLVEGFAPAPIKESLEDMGMLFGKGQKDILRKAYEGADLVQVQFPFFMARNAIKVAKKMKIPVIGAFHVQPQNVISAMGKESKLMETILFAFFKFMLLNRVEALHCPSKFAADLLTENNVKAHLRVISNGIPKEYYPQKLSRPKNFGTKFIILNIGRHALEKRQELLIEGLSKSKYKDNIQLILGGKGEDTEKLRKQGEKLPVKPIIDFISKEDKMLYLNTADMYLHASVVELESLSCLEAIGCGLPCLIGNSPYSAAPQFALDDRFLFEMDNSDDLAEKIDYWYENREEITRLKKDTIEMAESYRFNKAIDSMEKLYSDFITYSQKGEKRSLDEIEKSNPIKESLDDKKEISV